MSLRVAITAAAVRTALGDDAAETWRRFQAGESAVDLLQGIGLDELDRHRGAQIWREPAAPEDDPALRILGPHGRLLDAVAIEAHDAAGLGALPREEVGLFVAMGMVDSTAEDLAPAIQASRGGGSHLQMDAFFASGYRQIHPLWPLSMLNNVAVGQIAIDLDIRGDNVVLASDAVAGVRALLEAAYAVEEGTCRAALAAGVSGRITPSALARRSLQTEPATAELGEGGAALILEREDDARARGARVLGFVRGGVTAFRGDHPPLDHHLHAAIGDLGAGAPAVEVALRLAAPLATGATFTVGARGSQGAGHVEIEGAA